MSQTEKSIAIVEPGVHPHVPASDYHQWPMLSSTWLGKLHRSPAHLAAYIKEPPPDTNTFIVGRAAHSAILARMDLAKDDKLYVDKTGYGNLKRDLNRALGRTSARLQGPVLRFAGTGVKIPFHVTITDPVEAVAKTYKQALQAVFDKYVKGGKTVAVCSREMAQLAASLSPALKAAQTKAA